MNRSPSPALSVLLRKVALLAAALPLLALPLGCEASKPTRLELDPPEEMKFYKLDQRSSIQVSAFKETGKPYTAPLKLTWSSSDETVAKVDENGKVTPVGSGTAKVTATTHGVSESIDVKVMILGSLEFAADMPKEYKADQDKRLPIQLLVKDDRGNVMDTHPRVSYEATSGCIDVYQEGTFVAYQKGECSIIARCGDKEASFRVKVK